MISITLNTTTVVWVATLIVAGLVLLTVWLAHQNRKLTAVVQKADRTTKRVKINALKDRRGDAVQYESLEERYARLDQKLLGLESRQYRLEQRAGNSRPYERAMQMAGRGAGLEELIAAGLSRGEAELALRMHGLASN